MSLFLYLDTDSGLALLRDARLAFQTVEQLQDPFLSNRAVSAAPSRRQVSQQEIEAELARQYQALPPHLAELVSFDYFREQAQGRRAELESAVLARDQRPMADTLSAGQQQALALLRLFSSLTNPVLWERFGGQHRGVAIELDPQNEAMRAPLYESKPQMLQAVNYADERPAQATGRFVSLFQRPRGFMAEGEWRLVRPRSVADKEVERQGQQWCLYKTTPRLLRRLVFGCQVADEQRQRILTLIEHDQRYRHLKVQACEIDPYRYELHLRDLPLP